MYNSLKFNTMRLWEIREGYDPEEMRMGMRGGMSADEAYEQGCRHGYKKGYGDAMREASEEYGFRGDMGYREGSSRGQGGQSSGQSGRSGSSYGNRMFYPPYMNYRDEDEDMMNERRRRDSRGRYM